MENHYKTLGVDQQATQGEIKNAYRVLVKRFHPDTQSKNADHEEIIKINAAYEVLKDPNTRHKYDHHISTGENVSTDRQKRAAQAQQEYQQRRQKARETIDREANWLQEIYFPVNKLVSLIIKPLNREIDYLSADPFDDELMADFQTYLETCRSHLNKAKAKVNSQPNPSNLAGVAVHLYYCLERLDDAIEELERFTLNYDDHYLHTGQEIFRIAHQLNREAQQKAQTFFR